MPPEHGEWDVSNQAYHAERECESSTTLSAFRANRRLYHGMYVLGTVTRPTSEALSLGIALHTWTLERDQWDGQYAVIPPGDGRTKAVREAREEFEATLSGRTPISVKDFDRVRRMHDGMRRSERVMELLEPEGRHEVSIRWQHESGIWIKNRIDKLFPSGLIMDIKTSEDPYPESWGASAYRFGYHRQKSLYLEGAERVFGRAPAFVHVVVGSIEPFDAFVHELDSAALDLGRTENEKTLYDLALCRDLDSWDPPGYGEVNPISLPRWSFKRELTPTY